MFPDWHDHIHIPTVGDDVIVGSHTITVDPNRVRPQSFQVSVQPRTGMGVLLEQGRAILALLQSTHGDAARFLDRYVQSSMEAAEADELRVELKNLLENYRSALEYTAHYIADVCTPKPPQNRVQFPVAKPGDTAATFAPKLDRWFPGLSTSAPRVRDYLLSIQDFSGEPWLRQLADLTNFNKHRSLSAQEPGDFHSVVVRFGDAGVRLGELGLRSLSLETGGVLRFVNSAGQRVDLVGPVVLDANTTSLPGADPRIEVLSEKRRLYRIPGCNESIAGTLWSVDKNVFRAVDRICALLS
jgi:hypothetical protein